MSIVSALPGTTRDLVTFHLSLSGLPVKLIDSAGIRNSSCEIEDLGVQMAKQAYIIAILCFSLTFLVWCELT